MPNYPAIVPTDGVSPFAGQVISLSDLIKFYWKSQNLFLSVNISREGVGDFIYEVNLDGSCYVNYMDMTEIENDGNFPFTSEGKYLPSKNQTQYKSMEFELLEMADDKEIHHYFYIYFSVDIVDGVNYLRILGLIETSNLTDGLSMRVNIASDDISDEFTSIVGSDSVLYFYVPSNVNLISKHAELY